MVTTCSSLQLAGLEFDEKNREKALRFLKFLPDVETEVDVYVEGADEEPGTARIGDYLTLDISISYQQYIKESVGKKQARLAAEEAAKESEKKDEDEDDGVLALEEWDFKSNQTEKPTYTDYKDEDLRAYTPRLPFDKEDAWWILVVETAKSSKKTAAALSGKTKKKLKKLEKKEKKGDKNEKERKDKAEGPGGRIVQVTRVTMSEPYVRTKLKCNVPPVEGEREYTFHICSEAYFGLDPPAVTKK